VAEAGVAGPQDGLGAVGHLELGEDGRDVAEESRVLAGREDVWSHTLWRSVQATVLAQQGRTAEAERLARAAVELAAQTDFLDLHAGVLLTLAEVLRSAGNAPPVRTLLEDAALLYRQKGNLVSLARVETLLNH
jgi:hypothetical protein